MSKKKCCQCGKTKPCTEFYKHPSTADRLEHFCKLCRNKRSRENYKKDAENVKKRTTKWVKENKENRREIKNRYETKRRNTDPMYKFNVTIRTLIRNSFKLDGSRKAKKTTELLGCSIPDFFLYLGEKPEGDCHLDHICPCAQAQSTEELEKLQHYTNLRWLPAKENISKSDNKTPEAVAMCRNLLGREWI
jgi:hypothetical protein